jgi:hypothetical protein
MIAARTVLPRPWSGLLLTALLHVAIMWMVVQHKHIREDAPRAPRQAIQWLLPMQKPAPRPALTAPPPPAHRPPPRATAPAATAAAAAAAAPPQAQGAPMEPQPAAPPADAPDPFAPPPAPALSAGDIMAQARKDLGKIDKDLRKAYPERSTAALTDTKQARLQRAFDAAHDAVPPKWYEPAKIAEITPPNAHTRMYRITTALLTYCVTISEEGRKNYVNCPR